jgi:hypothetical protein
MKNPRRIRNALADLAALLSIFALSLAVLFLG